MNSGTLRTSSQYDQRPLSNSVSKATPRIAPTRDAEVGATAPSQPVVDHVENQPIALPDLDVDPFCGRPEPFDKQRTLGIRHLHAVDVNVNDEVIGDGEEAVGDQLAVKFTGSAKSLEGPDKSQDQESPDCRDSSHCLTLGVGLRFALLEPL